MAPATHFGRTWKMPARDEALLPPSAGFEALTYAVRRLCASRVDCIEHMVLLAISGRA
ncbi:hypothetical protein ABZ341_27675 [Streptomyces sp. NPDC006173]|uniref:hypothetical protein n=1 Tax=Streptomyces sp. NPDC006173 TaxID=3155349 RepID=UPI0033FD4760